MYGSFCCYFAHVKVCLFPVKSVTYMTVSGKVSVVYDFSLKSVMVSCPACDNGTYGLNCEKRCGHCKGPAEQTCDQTDERDNCVTSCHYVTGVCEAGCLIGYKAPVCKDGNHNHHCRLLLLSLSLTSTFYPAALDLATPDPASLLFVLPA